ncbi:3-carboxy-cis,cis-muconate cycloisomerase [Paractinoplanes deccanensis]|uniref:3-carboxy-cis,cis-muconate cycloisomerase n=1 Tax=Paractinoplanes deccanensis TaxID=113561 RepID=A0ABQ3YLD3_9ACTN|nr:lyase family protein [Actinoplanes deccanensis]GID80798.1 3-carboxy-cis,cis-muconate cycloisomerase [Actinoplanes deccanensis]
MSDLLWPGDTRAAGLCTDEAVLTALLHVESAWLAALHHHGLTASSSASPHPAVPGSGPPHLAPDLSDLVDSRDLADLARDAEEGGNPVIPLVKLLKKRADVGNIHAGLTSQDVLDTGLVLVLRDAAARIREDLATQIEALAALADRHRGTDMVARTLTQHAIPTTFGLKVTGWLQGVLDARDALAAQDLPIQIGGAAGSLAAPTALAGSPAKARELVATTAATLGLPMREPWHTSRAPLTRFADALVTCTDAWGKIANDVLVGARPEIGELREGRGGGSSAMPNKQNPVLSVLIRRAALAAPPLAATLHIAAADAVDERPDGSWHVEWATLRTLARRTVVAGSQTADLLTGLRADPVRMASTLAEARPGIDAEQRRYGPSDRPYLGATDEIIDAVLARAAEKPC